MISFESWCKDLKDPSWDNFGDIIIGFHHL